MRCLRRNKIPFWYATYAEGETAYDADGYETGGRNISYSKPVKSAANISAARDVAVAAIFGTDLNYDRILCLESAPFDENAILWIDTPPVIKRDGTTDTPPDYIVKRLAKSLNSVLVAVTKVATRV